MKILQIEHVGVALESSTELENFLGEILLLGEPRVEVVEAEGVSTEIFDTLQGKLELLTSSSNTSAISRFIDKRGPGLHHIALLVDDLQAWIEHLKQQEVELVNDKPQVGAEGHLYIFIHPRSTGGILVELCQKP